jgi:hypothetical protein
MVLVQGFGDVDGHQRGGGIRLSALLPPLSFFSPLSPPTTDNHPHTSSFHVPPGKGGRLGRSRGPVV